MKICKKIRVCFDPTPPQNVTFFHSNLLLDNSASFTSSRTKDLCQKWKTKLIFRGVWNSLMAWPDQPWPPCFTTSTDPRHCRFRTLTLIPHSNFRYGGPSPWTAVIDQRTRVCNTKRKRSQGHRLRIICSTHRTLNAWLPYPVLQVKAAQPSFLGFRPTGWILETTSYPVVSKWVSK